LIRDSLKDTVNRRLEEFGDIGPNGQSDIEQLLLVDME